MIFCLKCLWLRKFLGCIGHNLVVGENDCLTQVSCVNVYGVRCRLLTANEAHAAHTRSVVTGALGTKLLPAAPVVLI